MGDDNMTEETNEPVPLSCVVKYMSNRVLKDMWELVKKAKELFIFAIVMVAICVLGYYAVSAFGWYNVIQNSAWIIALAYMGLTIFHGEFNGDDNGGCVFLCGVTADGLMFMAWIFIAAVIGDGSALPGWFLPTFPWMPMITILVWVLPWCGYRYLLRVHRDAIQYCKKLISDKMNGAHT